MFTFADAPDKIDAEKPSPPSKIKAPHSPPPLRALKSAPDSAPKRRRSGPVVAIGKADEEDAIEASGPAPASKPPAAKKPVAVASSDDPGTPARSTWPDLAQYARFRTISNWSASGRQTAHSVRVCPSLWWTNCTQRSQRRRCRQCSL